MKWIDPEYFQNSQGRKSMPRLVVFWTLPFSSIVVLLHPEQLPNYLFAYVLSYGLGRGADAIEGIFKKEKNGGVLAAKKDSESGESDSR